ncbi:MAG: sulfite oxidase heme-binding subunit YedZ [Cypionkella sp.]
MRLTPVTGPPAEGGARRSRVSRPLVWLALAMPGCWIGYRWGFTPDRYGYGHAVADSGDWAAWLLMATLAVTPLRLLWPRARWSRWLVGRRRALGVATFAYAAGHTAIYLLHKASPAQVIADLALPGLLLGWLALTLFAPLAATSNDASMRRLKRGWKKLHRLVYPAAILTFAHWVLTAFDPTIAWAHAAVLAVIEAVRIALQRRQRVT